MTGLTLISRKEARAAGLVHYFTGRPCRRGHIGGRYETDRSCVVCKEALTTTVNESRATERGPAEGRLYNNLRANSRARGHCPPPFTLHEFRQWVLAEWDPAEQFWGVAFVFSRRHPHRPSVDRIYSNLPYTFNNIQLVPWLYNNWKGDGSDEAAWHMWQAYIAKRNRMINEGRCPV